MRWLSLPIDLLELRRWAEYNRKLEQRLVEPAEGEADELPKTIAAYEDYVAKLLALASSRNASLVVVFHAVRHARKFDNEVKEVLDKHSVVHMDISRELHLFAQGKGLSIVLPDSHYNREGNLLLARLVGEELPRRIWNGVGPQDAD